MSSQTMPDIISTTTQSQSTRKRVRRLGTVGGLMAGAGGLTTLLFPYILSACMNSDLGYTIKEGNMITKNWKETPFPIMTSAYVFTIENPEAFRRGAKPRVKEMGPYVYTTRRWKEIISWGRNQETVKYYALTSYHFDGESSVGSLSDKITIVNVPVYAMSAVVRGIISKLPLSLFLSSVTFPSLNVFLASHGEGFLKTLTVGELLGGYPFRILDTIDVLSKPLTWFGIQLPDPGMPQNRFGILHVKNYTRGKPYEVYTGQGDTDFIKFFTWNGKRGLGMYGNTKCDALNGTDGTRLGTFLTQDDILYLFNADTCRAIYLTYKERSSVRGIPAWRFTLPPAMFAAPNKNPANKCFCQTPNDYDMCDGILDLGPCQNGAPLALSYPHLMWASNKIQAGVDGLAPNPELHESRFDMEPTIGSPMSVSARLQINLLMKPNSFLFGFRGFKEVVLPLVWLEESVEIQGQFEWMLKAAIYPMLATDYGSIALMLGGMGLLGYTGQMAVRKRKIIFPPNTEEEDLIAGTQSKSNYPFTIDSRVNDRGQGLKTPPHYDDIQRQYSNRENPIPNDLQNLTQTQSDDTLIGYNRNQQRVSWSPPGAVDKP